MASHIKQPCGYLDVTIVGCSNLVAVEGHLVGHSSSDPYCLCSLDDQDQLIQTPVVSRNVHPKWDFPTTLFVKNAASLLHLTVMNKGNDSRINLQKLDINLHKHEDLPLGRLVIPLSALPYNQTIEGWFALLPPEHHPIDATTGSDTTAKDDAARPSTPSTTLSPPSEHFGRIMLRLHYETTKQAQFYAGFQPPPPIPVAPPLPFSADHAYVSLMRCLEYLWPILDVVWKLMDIQHWTSPVRSCCFLIAWYYVCVYYQYVPVFVHLFLMLKMCVEYIHLHIQEHPHGASEVDKLRKTIKPLHQDARRDSDEIASIGTFVDRVATYLIGRGLGETLQTTQNVLGSVADGLDGLTGLLTWENRETSRQLLVGLLVSCCLFAAVDFRYWLLVGSLYMMTSCTKVYAFVVYTVLGLTKFFSLSPTFNGIKQRLPQLIKVRKVRMS